MQIAIMVTSSNGIIHSFESYMLRTSLSKTSLLFALTLFVVAPLVSAQDLPQAADQLKIEWIAKEPLVRNPCALAFDHHGRLFIGMGPQYRSPSPETPGDSVFLLTDTNGDGSFDSR